MGIEKIHIPTASAADNSNFDKVAHDNSSAPSNSSDPVDPPTRLPPVPPPKKPLEPRSAPRNTAPAKNNATAAASEGSSIANNAATQAATKSPKKKKQKSSPTKKSNTTTSNTTNESNPRTGQRWYNNEEKRLLLLDFGKSQPCDPTPAPLAREGEIKWGWCPRWSWMCALVLGLLVLIVISFIMMIMGGPAGIAFGLLLLLFCLVTICALGNWQWNSNKQYAYSLARGKRLEALELWAEIDETQKFRAKDVFFQTRYGGKQLVVLRDGTVECYGSHKDDIFEMMEENAKDEGGEDGGDEGLEETMGADEGDLELPTDP